MKRWHGGWLRRGQLLDECSIIAENGIRVAICHGRGDYVCQPQAAWRLSQALRAAGGEVELEFVAGAGHSEVSSKLRCMASLRFQVFI